MDHSLRYEGLPSNMTIVFNMHVCVWGQHLYQSPDTSLKFIKSANALMT
jgi:hypothetical protein